MSTVEVHDTFTEFMVRTEEIVRYLNASPLLTKRHEAFEVYATDRDAKTITARAVYNPEISLTFTMIVHLNRPEDTTIKVVGEYPAEGRKVYPESERYRQRPIGFSASETAPRAAETILKRFLEGYLDAYDMGVEERRMERDFDLARHAIAAELAAILDVKPGASRPYAFSRYRDEGGYILGEVERPDSIRLDLHDLGPGTAKAVLLVIAGKGDV